MLIFNRTPKAASESILILLTKLSLANNFNAYNRNAELIDRGENNYMSSVLERKTYVDLLRHTGNVTLPCSYSKHMNFLDFEEFNFTNPIYINFVRDPVERIISWYYYTRQSWYLIHPREDDKFRELDAEKLSPKSLKMPFEECVLRGEPECQYNPGDKTNDPSRGGSHTSQVSFVSLLRSRRSQSSASKVNKNKKHQI